MIIETKMAVVAVIAAIGGALMQATTTTAENNVVLYIAAMSSFVALMGVVVTGFVQWSASRAAIEAAREAREAAREARDEARIAATEQKTITGNIEHLVNSKADKQAEIIKELTDKVDRLNAAALAKAEAAPAIKTVTDPNEEK